MGRTSMATKSITTADYYRKCAAAIEIKGPTSAAVAYGMLTVLKSLGQLPDETLWDKLSDEVAPQLTIEDNKWQEHLRMKRAQYAILHPTQGVAASAERS